MVRRRIDSKFEKVESIVISRNYKMNHIQINHSIYQDTTLLRLNEDTLTFSTSGTFLSELDKKRRWTNLVKFTETGMGL